MAHIITEIFYRDSIPAYFNCQRDLGWLLQYRNVDDSSLMAKTKKQEESLDSMQTRMGGNSEWLADIFAEKKLKQ